MKLIVAHIAFFAQAPQHALAFYRIEPAPRALHHILQQDLLACDIALPIFMAVLLIIVFSLIPALLSLHLTVNTASHFLLDGLCD